MGVRPADSNSEIQRQSMVSSTTASDGVVEKGGGNAESQM